MSEESKIKSFYEILGPDGVQLLVTRFYDFVFEDERINHLFKNDKEEIKAKQYAFLTQFLGGPFLYNETYGHPRMRMRHMPHKITKAAAKAWLENMDKAIQTLDVEEDVKIKLFNCFPKLAGHMINTLED